MLQKILLSPAQAAILNDLELDVQRASKLRQTALYTIIAGVTGNAKFISADINAREIVIEVPDLKLEKENKVEKEDKPQTD